MVHTATSIVSYIFGICLQNSSLSGKTQGYPERKNTCYIHGQMLRSMHMDMWHGNFELMGQRTQRGDSNFNKIHIIYIFLNAISMKTVPANYWDWKQT